MEINNTSELYRVFDKLSPDMDWSDFYKSKQFNAPFILNNRLPDKAMFDFITTHSVSSAVEFGCGEGRNAVFMARSCADVLAIDSSSTAIEEAKRYAENEGISVRFVADDTLSYDYQSQTFALAVDSGMFHHLSPYRRLEYRDMLCRVLQKGGCYILLCFASGTGGADELDDLDFYKRPSVGVAFTRERLIRFFENDFEIVDIALCGSEKTERYIDIPFLWRCLMRKKEHSARNQYYQTDNIEAKGTLNYGVFKGSTSVDHGKLMWVDDRYQPHRITKS